MGGMKKAPNPRRGYLRPKNTTQYRRKKKCLNWDGWDEKSPQPPKGAI